jgi:CheY-like chemotaxis protein
LAKPTGEKTLPPTLLVVEDDPLVMLSAALLLEDHGWTVKKAANGSVAMERLEELVSDVDALVIDVQLGEGPSGWDVARFARAVRPAIPVAYITGYDDADFHSQMVDGGIMLEKPVADGALLAALGGLIGRAT